MVNKSQTRFVSPKAWNRIEQWSRRKPVFALMGEFSAGKSTLMNFLLRKTGPADTGHGNSAAAGLVQLGQSASLY